MSYEGAVYMDDIRELTNAVVELVQTRLKEFPDGFAKTSVAAAALGTAANILDQAEFNPIGVTGKLRTVCLEWQR